MTREEAIEVIKAYKDKLTNSASNQLDGDIEAFDMAIKALKQKPCDDAVSREAFKFDEWDIGDKKAELWVIKGRLQIRHRGTIHNVDFPVLPKREHGEWIEEKYGYRCNKCNHFYEGEWSIKDNAMMPQKYCPNCGSRNGD